MKKGLLSIILSTLLITSCKEEVPELKGSILNGNLTTNQFYLTQLLTDDDSVNLPLKTTEALSLSQIKNVKTNSNETIKDYQLKDLGDNNYILSFKSEVDIWNVAISIDDDNYTFKTNIKHIDETDAYTKDYSFKLIDFNISEQYSMDKYEFTYLLRMSDDFSLIAPKTFNIENPMNYGTATLTNLKGKSVSNESLTGGTKYLLTINATEKYNLYYFDALVPFSVKVDGKEQIIIPSDSREDVLSSLLNHGLDK